MSRIYTVQTSAVTLDEDRDLFEVLAATGKQVTIHGWSLLQISDVGDAAEEVARLEEVRGAGAVTSGSGGSSPTIYPLCGDDTAGGATVEANNTTRMVVGSGALHVLMQYGWNIRIPIVHFYPPELRPHVHPGDRWTLAILAAALADAVTFSSGLWFEEI